MKIASKNYTVPSEIMASRDSIDQWKDFRFIPTRSHEGTCCFEILTKEYDSLRAVENMDVLVIDVLPGGELTPQDHILASVKGRVQLLRWTGDAILNFEETKQVREQDIQWTLGPVSMTCQFFSKRQLLERRKAA